MLAGRPSPPPAGRGPRPVLGPPASGLTGQGVGSETAAPKISELPNVAGQFACGAGVWADGPVRSATHPAAPAREGARLPSALLTPSPPPPGATVVPPS